MNKFSGLLIVAGIVSLVGGVFAILNPFIATVAAATLAALSLVISGGMTIFSSFAEPDWRSRAPSIILAAVAIVLGIAILRHPAAGLAALTMLIGLSFLFSGLAKMAWAWIHRHDASLWPLVVSGVLSLILAYLIYQNVRSGRSDILGVFLGVELMLNGIAFVSVGAVGRRIAKHVGEAKA